MKTIVSCLVVVLCFLVPFGCSSNAPTRYYVLTPITVEKSVQQDAQCTSVGVGPIRLPEYVNRLQIVTRTTANGLTVSNFDLWAEPVIDSTPRILAENISRLLCTRDVVLFPWKSSQTPDYRVEVEVIRMDGSLDRSIAVEAWWSVANGGDGKKRVTKRSTYNEPVKEGGYEGLVQAHSRALGSLSRDIAEALKGMSRGVQ